MCRITTYEYIPAAGIARNLQLQYRPFHHSIQFKPFSLARSSTSGQDAGSLRNSSHQPLWTQSAKLTADSIGQDEIAGVSRLSQLNSVLKRWPRSRCLAFGLEECWDDICDTALCVPVLRGREHNGPAYHFHPLPPPPPHTLPISINMSNTM